MANPKNRKEFEPMLTASDVAGLLNVHINTVRRWSDQGILKAYRIGSRGDRRFQQEDIANFLLRRSKVANGREESSLTDKTLRSGTSFLVERRK